MAVENGSNMILKLYPYGQGNGEVNMMHSRTCSIDIALDSLDVSTSDSGGWHEFIGTHRSWTISADGLMDFAALNPINTSAYIVNMKHLFGQLVNRASGSVTFTPVSPNAGEIFFTGNVLVTSINISGGTEDAPTYSVTLKGTGALSLSTAT